MAFLTRRSALGAALSGAAVAGSALAKPSSPPLWTRGVDGQRKADLGHGTFLNPVMAGDHPDPSVLKDGDDYYMTFSSFDAYPGLVIWHSRDLVNWEPLGPSLFENVGSVWAPDLVKHNGLYFIYFPGHNSNGPTGNFVVYADDIRGPWSAPIDLKLPSHIDPGHIVGEDGLRYLFLSGGDYVRLADDGLSTVGDIKHVYDGWKYPEDWDVESFSPEGPKMLRHGDWFYMTLAEGGTAGPPTSHMVVSARSRSVHGPWENSPHNPVTRTKSRSEKWWSRGHATLVEAPDKSWWMMHHGYEKRLLDAGQADFAGAHTLDKRGMVRGGRRRFGARHTKTARRSGQCHTGWRFPMTSRKTLSDCNGRFTIRRRMSANAHAWRTAC